MSSRTLVAGVGNIFLGDDAFGVEVATRLASQHLPRGVKVEDFGIRGMHLAYELLEGYDLALLVDASPRGGTPGDLYVIEPETAAVAESGAEGTPFDAFDAHGMEPGSVLSMVQKLGGDARILVVGCEPADTGEHIGLSAPVTDAVDRAVPLIMSLLETETSVIAATKSEEEM